MSLSIIQSRAGVGITAPIVSVEVHLSRGLPSFSIVGLPATAVKESRDRVRGAIVNSNFDFPRQRIIVNLAPADLPKEGGRFDLPIAIGILVASGQINAGKVDRYVFLGELALSGALREIRGALVAALSLRGLTETLVLPRSSAAQAALVKAVRVNIADSLGQVAAMLNGLETLEQAVSVLPTELQTCLDFSDVIGQKMAKRALEIAAAGHHSMLMIGPPGAGKTMLASRLGGILPPMSEDEALEAAAIASLGHSGFEPARWRQRPFRSPHHSASGAALIGGGSVPAPGEISLAHNGVLFLDELPEFSRHVLQLLREPMESGIVHISRAARQSSFLAEFLFIAAANPCPCGYLGDPVRCQCSAHQIQNYHAKLSGPLLDRIDMHLTIHPVKTAELHEIPENIESSAEIRHRVTAARQHQLTRQGRVNAHLDSSDLRNYCQLDSNQTALLEQTIDRFALSTRACHRILKLARTIADLADYSNIKDEHLLEAVKLRCTEFKN